MEKLPKDGKRPKAQRQSQTQRLAPMMRALKALHSAGTPEELTPEELERQRRNQEILGRLTAPMPGMAWEEVRLGDHGGRA